MGYMTGYVCSPQQWAYVRVTGALAAAAVHSPLLTMVSRFCNLPTATLTVHVATVLPLTPPPRSKQQKKSCIGPRGQKVGLSIIQVI